MLNISQPFRSVERHILEMQFQEHYTKHCLVSLFCLFLLFTGCTRQENPSSPSDSEVRIVKTTDNGDDVIQEEHGNQLTVRTKDSIIQFYTTDYHTDATELLPFKNEISADYCTDPQLSSVSFNVSIVFQSAPDTEGTDTAYLNQICYFDQGHRFSMQEEGKSERINSNLRQDLTDYFETDQCSSLCEELFETVQEYMKLKNINE